MREFKTLLIMKLSSSQMLLIIEAWSQIDAESFGSSACTRFNDR